MSKYADDTYLVIPADNIHSCHSELSSIENWALNNNLKLNHAKSVEIVFVKPGSKRRLTERPKVVSGYSLHSHKLYASRDCKDARGHFQWEILCLAAR